MNPGAGFGWGIAGARAAVRAAGPDGALVVVDVLSFSTAVTIATGRGTAVYPQPWPPGDVASFAAAHGAVLAAGREEVTEHHPWSLSPAHLARAPARGRLVLPSPNGSAISAAGGGVILAGCLRNATAVARWLEVRGFGTPVRAVTVIAAGEHWPADDPQPGAEASPARKASPVRGTSRAGKASPARKASPAGKAGPTRKASRAGKASPARKASPAGKAGPAGGTGPAVSCGRRWRTCSARRRSSPHWAHTRRARPRRRPPRPCGTSTPGTQPNCSANAPPPRNWPPAASPTTCRWPPRTTPRTPSRSSPTAPSAPGKPPRPPPGKRIPS